MAQMSSSSTQFKRGVLEGLARVEHFALQEVERLGRELQQLRGENEQLRQQLAERGACSASSELSDDRAEVAVQESRKALAPAEAQATDEALSPRHVGVAVEVVEAPMKSEGSQEVPGEQHDDEDTATSASEPARPRVARSSTISELHLSLPGDSPAPKSSPGRSRPSQRTASTPAHAEVAEGECWVRRLVTSSHFDNVTMAFIILNSVWLGIEADTNAKPLLQSPPIYQVVENVFCLIFVTEFVLRSYCHWLDGIGSALVDKWYVFDLVLVPLMVIDTWVLNVIILITGRYELSGYGFFSVLRMLRMSRIVRMVRICRIVPELATMVSSMVAGIRSVLITSIILFVMTYGFAILMREMSESTAWGQELFSSVPSSVYTLLVQSVLPDNGDLLDAMLADSWLCGALYFIFLLLTAIMVVNMLIALLCDVVSKVSQDDLAQRTLATLSVKLETILSSIDDDYDGVVSRAEFERIIDHPEAMQLLQDVGVDVDALVDDADFIFQNHAKPLLTFEDFKEEVLQFRQTSFATMGTMIATRRFIRLSLEQIAAKIVGVDSIMRELKDELGCLSRARELASLVVPELGAKPPSLPTDPSDHHGPPELADRFVRSTTPDCTAYGELFLGVARLWPGSSRRQGLSVELS